MELEIFNFDTLTEHVLASTPKKILVLGLGGKTDIYSAYGVAQRLNQSLVEINKNKGVKIAYGNIKKGNGPDKSIDTGIYTKIDNKQYLYGIVGVNQLPNDITTVGDNDLVFESSIPINAFGMISPLLFYSNGDNEKDIADLLYSNFDVIITVNNGGGSYIFTKDKITDTKFKIDNDYRYLKIYHIMRILDVLKKEKGKTIIQLFIAPAIDGVLSVEDMNKCIDGTYKEGIYKPDFYLGSFFLKNVYDDYSKNLASEIPNLILEGIKAYNEDINKKIKIKANGKSDFPVYLTTLIAVFLHL